MAENVANRVQSSNGMMPGTKFFSSWPFSGVNFQASPIAMDDREFKWQENFIRLGDGNLRTAWDVGPLVFLAPPLTQIVSLFAYTIGSNDYLAVFTSDGRTVQIDTNINQFTTFGRGGQFYTAGGSAPAATQWGVQYLIITNRNTENDYWLWDGSILYQAGSAAPNGVTLLSTGYNYTSVPTVTAFGGHGSGMTFNPIINAGGVVNVEITNPGSGYQVGDVVQLAFSGGGSDTSAILTANLAAGSVAAANITAPGSGYSTVSVAFSGGGGSGAAATGVIGSGVSSIAVTAGGSGYTSVPLVTFSGGGGAGAAAVATLVGGIVTQVTVTNPGTGYTSAPTVGFSGGAGTGAAATATVQNAIIIAINITNGGSGYTSAPSINITGTGGSGATAQAILSGTNVASVTVTNAGSGFVYAPQLQFVGGNGTGAAGIAVLTGTSIARINITSTGANYSITPKLTISTDSGGTGASATPVMSGGRVVAVTLNSGGSGYTGQPEVFFTADKNDTTGGGAGAQVILAATTIASVQMTDYGLNYTDAPAVQVLAGANHSAYAVVQMMPFGISGDSVETFQQRVWIANPAPSPFSTLPPGGDFAVSAPGSFTDYATSDGGVLFTNSDGFLQKQYTHIQQSNGYLYFFGDSSVSVVSNVQTSGNPTTTTFSYQNVDPDTGASWRDSVLAFGRTILMANKTGVYGIYGGAATKITKKLDQLFQQAVFPPDPRAITPSAAVATIFQVKHYLLLMTVRDPDTGTYRNVMVTWNEETWSITSQTVPLVYITSQKIESKFIAWGTDGQRLYRLFQQPSATLVKRLDTKLFGSPTNYMVKELFGIYLTCNDQTGTGITIDLAADVSGLAIQPADPGFENVPSGVTGNFTLQFPVTFAPDPTNNFWPTWGSGTGGGSFVNIGLRLTTTSPDFVIGNLLISYRDEAAIQ